MLKTCDQSVCLSSGQQQSCPASPLSLAGDGVGVWNIAHVTLTVTTKFRYFFHGSRGSTVSSGAILLDDITLTETACPRAAWTIQNFTHLLSSEPFGGRVRSPRFYNAEGYGYGVDLYANGRNGSSPDYVGVTFHLFSGENDAVLEWPVASRQMTVTIMDQDPDVKLRMSSSRSFTTGGSRLQIDLKSFTLEPLTAGQVVAGYDSVTLTL